MLKKFVSIVSVVALSVAFVGCEAAADKAVDGAATTPAVTTEEHTEAAVAPPAEAAPVTEAAPEAAK